MNLQASANPPNPTCSRATPAGALWAAQSHSARTLGAMVAFAGLFAASPAFAASSATVSWNRNPETNITGYRLAYGTTLGVYNNLVEVGTNPTTSVSGLTEGTTYYFVVSAVNQSGLQSQPSAVVSYWVPPVATNNRAPVALANSLTVPEDTALNLVLTGTDPDSNPLTFSVVRAPAKGVLTGTPPNLRFTPNADANGSDSFTFIANDGNLNSAAATVSINITPVNDAPVATSKTVATNNRTQLPILLNGSDKDSFTLTYSVVTGPTSGTLLGTAPNLTYSPSSNFVGTDRFTYRVNDGALNSALATITINVTQGTLPPANAPVALAQALTVPEDTSLNLVLTGTDPENAPLTFSVARAPAKGVITGTPPNLRYTPTADYFGSDSFTFIANDGGLNSAAATISITVSPVNDAPVAASKTVTTPRNTQLAILLDGSDKESSALTYTVVTNPTNGSLSGTAPNLTYRPATNFTGTDRFTFRVRDGARNSNVATITINVPQAVTPPASPPVALAQSLAVAEDTPLNLVLTGTDADNAPLTYTVTQAPAKGALTGTPPNLKYTPAADYHGSDSFSFIANDGGMNSSPAVISIAVTPVNDAPVAVSKTVTTNNLSPLEILLDGSDKDTSALTYTVVANPANGSLTGTAPNLTYTPSASFVGMDEFTFIASDGTLDSALETITIDVTQATTTPPPGTTPPGTTPPGTINPDTNPLPNVPPFFARNPIFVADASVGKPYRGSTLAGTAVDTEAVTYQKVSGPKWLNVAANGDLSGTPAVANAGLNTFVVRATDSASASADAELQISVSKLPLPWRTRDIGNKRTPGSTFFEAGKFTNSGSGTLGGTTDKLRFTYQILTNDGQITAKISSLPETAATGRFGVMIRSSLAQNAPQVFMGLTNGAAYRLVTRTEPGKKTTTKSSTARTKSNTWVRLTSKDGKISAYKSSNGINWTFVGSTKMKLPADCYVGLAVASGSDADLQTVQFSNVTVTP